MGAAAGRYASALIALAILLRARMPAVAVTAFARAEDRARALQAGYQIHVAKPVQPAELVAVVASVAGRG